MAAAAQEQQSGAADLWTNILESATRTSQRATPSKTLLVLGASQSSSSSDRTEYPREHTSDSLSGDAKSGKTTLVSQLGSSSSAPVASTSKASTLDLGLSFSYLDIKDDAEEGA